MRNLAVVIEEMMAVLPDGEPSRYEDIRFALRQAQRGMSYCPREVMRIWWEAVAESMVVLWERDNECREKGVKPDAVEQQLIDIFRGPEKPRAHVVELPSDPPVWGSGPPYGKVVRFAECYCTLPEHKPGDPIVLGHSI